MDAPDGFRFSVAITIRYGDQDTLGHVNNAKYFTYLEQSRVLYTRHLKMWNGSTSEAGIIIARVELDFRAPLTLADGTATVWTRVSRLGTKSFDMAHLVTVERPDRRLVALEAKTVGVAYDYVTNATIPLPEHWRVAVAAYEPALQG